MSAVVANDDVVAGSLSLGQKTSVNGYVLGNDAGDGLNITGIRTGAEAGGGKFHTVQTPGGIGPSDPVTIEGKYGLLVIQNSGVWQYELRGFAATEGLEVGHHD